MDRTRFYFEYYGQNRGFVEVKCFSSNILQIIIFKLVKKKLFILLDDGILELDREIDIKYTGNRMIQFNLIIF